MLANIRATCMWVMPVQNGRYIGRGEVAEEVRGRELL